MKENGIIVKQIIPGVVIQGWMGTGTYDVYVCGGGAFVYVWI